MVHYARPRWTGHGDGSGHRLPADPGAAQARSGADVSVAAGAGVSFIAARRSGLRRDVSGVGVGSRGVGGVAPTYGFGGARIIAASLVPACHVPSPATRGLRTDRTALAGAARGQPVPRPEPRHRHQVRSEEHTSELQSLMRISYAVFCLKKKKSTQ